MTQSDFDALEDLPPSSKLVFKTLEWNGRLTQQEIIQKSLLSGRTVRDALTRLKQHGIVEEDVYYRDARQNIYTLTVADAGVDEGETGTTAD